ncbi:hypothetical protein FA95DRAFT_1503142 [Auriscalpium vulgare]|uniref:Uncharacterized protein n=1 Tax=Auriscalpium vulgare TaxID=40419 RepID=A0ACB8R7Y6_9AGAM|nr:hypothetical protein FA95DRAFT_1503142 [Auriscalpium vulgare]
MPPPEPAQLWDDLHVEPFGEDAGAPIAAEDASYDQYAGVLDAEDPDNHYHPFPNKLAWEIARWAKMRGPTSTALNELLAIDEVVAKLDLPFKNAKELNRIVDRMLPARPAFHRDEITVAGETFEFYHRDPIECIRALYGDPEFAPHLAFTPEKRFSDENRHNRVYSQMNTGKWWWRVQRAIENRMRGGTVVPLIVSTDMTQLTLFRNRAAYPIYLTIGNIPKEIRRKPSRRAHVLLGYLPTVKLTHIKNSETRRRARANVFHACVRRILEPLEAPGRDGLPMASGDGVVRRCHPILAAFVGDYPEQCLVVGCKNKQCPKGCILEPGHLGDHVIAPRRDIEEVINALESYDGDPIDFINACQAAGVKPIHRPFWLHLPYVDIYQAITPDILHQLYQGLVKHAIAWVRRAYGDTEVDARFARLPPNHNLRLFASGISHMSRVSGTEHRDICRVLLGVIADIPLPQGRVASARFTSAIRALLDFVYVAQYPSHNDDTLGYLRTRLRLFHQNKAIFATLGINLELPKLHAMLHYAESIELFGTTDNYNTEYTERLHIDLAKQAYRATNHKDEYPQMTTWLIRKEKIYRHERFIQWRIDGEPEIGGLEPAAIPRNLRLKLTKRPTAKFVSFANASMHYGADQLKARFAEYVISWHNPNMHTRQVRDVAKTFVHQFEGVAAYHKVKFWHEDAQGRDEAPQTLDSVHARPAYRDTQGRIRPGRFDTALLEMDDLDEDSVGVQGHRVAQVRLMFSLTKTAHEKTFGVHSDAPRHFAYVEWFSKFGPAAEPHHNMYRVQRSFRDNQRLASIVDISDLIRSIHLIPRFGAVAPRNWTSANVLELATSFYVNCFTDRNTYITVY